MSNISLLQDFKYAARGLRKAPGFTLVAVATLGLGIGANSAVFTVVDAVMLKGLPYRDADRLVHIWETEPRQPSRQVSYPDFKDVDGRVPSVPLVAGYAFDGFVLRTGEGSERLSAGRVSANFFKVLGVDPIQGRDFRADEDQPLGQRTVALISYGLWQRRFAGAPSVVGKSITLDDAPFTVVGVLPKEFHFARLSDPDLFVTLSPGKNAVERRYMHWMWAIGRLRDGATREQANLELESLAKARAESDPQWHKGTSLRAAPLREALVGPMGPVVMGLFAAVGAVLLIACANVANMLLARAMGRKREMGVRLAMGAGRGRIVTQFLAESILLSLAGGAAGLLWAGWGVRTMVAAIPANTAAGMPFLKGLSVDPRVLAFTFAVCLATGLVFGLIPALRASSAQVLESLKDGARGSAGKPRMRSALVVAEVAIALSLVAVAGLMARSLGRLLDVKPGFETSNLLTARVALPASRYDTPAKTVAFFDSWAARISGLPAVSGVAFVNRLPLLGSGNTGTPTVPGRSTGDANAPDSELRTVSEGYFSVMGLPLLNGRGFSAADRPESRPVVMVNQEFATQIFGGDDPVGRTLTFPFTDAPLEIVGVVGNEKAGDLDRKVRPVLYFPWRQEGPSSTSVVLRLKSEAPTLGSTLAAESRAMEPDAIVSSVRTMDEIIASVPATFLRRYPLMILGAFALLALVLAAIGIYGVMSLAVNERQSEIGIRMALGAPTASILRLVLKQGLGLAALGVSGGIGLGLAFSRTLASVLFETPPFDPAVFAAAAFVLLAVATLAVYVPARRASRVDPLVAVRHE